MKPYTSRILALAGGVFQRTLGVEAQTYQAMRGVLVEREAGKKKSGRQAALDLDDQLVLTLSFWREYRTYHHLSLAWEVNERTVRRTVERVEDALIASGRFNLPGRKALQEDFNLEVVVIDLAESPVERPKKSKGATTAARRSGTPTKAR